MNFISFDFETTGFKSQTDEIIEFSFIKFVNSVPTTTFSSLVKPKKSIPSHITTLTQIDDLLVKTSPAISILAPQVSQFISNDLLIAYNAGFDKNFLNVMFYQSKIHSHYNPYACALKLVKKALNLSYMPKLGDAVKLLDIPLPDAFHRAEADALVSGLLVVKWCEILNWTQLDLNAFSQPLKKDKDLTLKP